MTKVEILCEGSTMEVDVDTISKSPILISMHKKSKLQKQIEIVNISYPILRKIIEFCEHYRHSTPKAIQNPLTGWDLRESGVDVWDQDFIDLQNLQFIVDLMVSADFLEVQELVVLCCAKIASEMRRVKEQPSADCPLKTTSVLS